MKTDSKGISTMALAAVMVAGFSVVACSSDTDDSDTLSFSPDEGDQRTYQVVMQQGVYQSDRRVGPETSVHQLLSYTALEGGNAPVVEVWPGYMNMSVSQPHGTDFSSARVDSHERRGMALVRDVMDGGFLLEFDQHGAPLLIFQAQDQWQELLQDDPQMLEMMDEQFARPLDLDGLEPEPGASMIVEDFPGLDRVRLTVDEVWPEEVVAHLTVDGDDERAFGVLVLERDSGWLKSMALATSVAEDDRGRSGRVETALMMVPGSTPYRTIVDGLDGVPGGEAHYVRPSDDSAPDWSRFGSLEHQDVFADGQQLLDVRGWLGRGGNVRATSDSPRLKAVRHGVHEAVALGRLAVDDVRFLAADGTALDIDTFTGGLAFEGVYTDTADHEAGQDPDDIEWEFETVIPVFPLGWAHSSSLLDDLARVELDASYYSGSIESVSLALDPDGVSEKRVDGLTMRAIPVDERTFEIHYRGQAGTTPVNDVWSIEDAEFKRWPRHPKLPDWLGESQESVIEYVRRTGSGVADRYRVRFDDEAPDALVLDVIRLDDDPAFQETITEQVR